MERVIELDPDDIYLDHHINNLEFSPIVNALGIAEITGGIRL